MTRELVFNANQPTVHLVVTATDHGSPVRQSTAITVQITVQDVNDHAPVFTLAYYRSLCLSLEICIGDFGGPMWAVSCRANNTLYAPCALRGSKNRSTPFPDWR